MMMNTSQKGDSCINKKIDLAQCEALNMEGSCSVKDVFFGGYIRSNEKEPELIVNIVFLEQVNLNGILVECLNTERLPCSMSLYVNSYIDLGSVEDSKPSELFVMDNKVINKKQTLKIAKFRNVTKLSVCIFLKIDLLY